MEQFHYVIALYPDCIEGIALVQEEHFLKVVSKISWSQNEVVAEHPQNTFAQLDDFLTHQGWNEAYVSVLMPSSEVLIRRLQFPFQDPKKIEQVLPFEVSQELLEDVDTLHITHQILPQDDESAEVVLYLIDKDYLEQMKQTFGAHNLLIKNVDFYAHSLSKTLPANIEQKTFQAYLGLDDAFISIIDDGRLQQVKNISHQISLMIYPLLYPTPANPKDVQQHLNTHQDSEEAQETKELSQNMLNALETIQGSIDAQAQKKLHRDLEWLTSQLNLFLKTHHFHPEQCRIDVIGPLKEFVVWSNSRFVVQFPSIEELKQFIQSKPLHGVLGTLSEYDPRHLEGHDLSFYSEGTPLKRFFKKNRFPLVMMASLFCLLLTLAGLNTAWVFKLQREELKVLDAQIQQVLQGQVPNKLVTDPKGAIQWWKEQIASKKQSQEGGRPFETRAYENLNFLKELTTVMKSLQSEKGVKLEVERLSWSERRFAINGIISSYDGLELLKKKLSELEPLKEGSLTENNRSTPDGVLYRLTINLK